MRGGASYQHTARKEQKTDSGSIGSRSRVLGFVLFCLFLNSRLSSNVVSCFSSLFKTCPAWAVEVTRGTTRAM